MPGKTAIAQEAERARAGVWICIAGCYGSVSLPAPPLWGVDWRAIQTVHPHLLPAFGAKIHSRRGCPAQKAAQRQRNARRGLRP